MISLMPHQQEAVRFFRDHHGNALFYHDPGCGKTFAAAEVMRRCLLKQQGSILIVCPAPLVAQWHTELARYLSPEELTCTHVINYEKLAHKKYGAPLLKQEFLLVVADECQRLNNPTAKSVKIFKKIKTTYKLALSGTPAPNAEHELWSLIDWFNPGILGKNYTEFKRVFCNTHPVFHTILSLRDPLFFRTLVANYIHRVHKEEVLTDLPEKSTRTIMVELSPEHRAAYDQMKKTLIVEKAGEKMTIANVVALIGYLRQAIDCPSVVGIHLCSPKIEALSNLFVTSKQKPTIIFCEHKQAVNELHHLFSGGVITSDTSLKERNNICTAFQVGNINILIGTSALQLGLNLQRAERVIHYSYPFNNARVEQRVARAYRHGQIKKVEEIFLCCVNTIDEKIAALIEKKKRMEDKYTKMELLSLLQ